MEEPFAKCITYQAGYNYRLVKPYSVYLGIPTITGEPVVTDWITYIDGVMTLLRGYAWDGASGPARDTKSIMRAAAEHDGGYQLIRLGYIAPEYRAFFDFLFRETYRADVARSASWWRRAIGKVRKDWLYLGVHWFGGPSAEPSAERPVLTAP